MRHRDFWRKHDGTDRRPPLKRTAKARVRRVSRRDPVVLSADGSEIKSDAYRGRGDLRHVIIPEGVTHSGESAFYGCKWLKSVTLPSTLEVIGDYAFRGCKRIKSIVIPEGVSNIGTNAFEDCKNLEDVTLPNRLESIGFLIFGGCYYLNYNYYGRCKYLGSASNPYLMCKWAGGDLHPDTKIISTGAYHYSSEKYVILPDGLEIISAFAFTDSAVEYISIPHSVKVVNKNAFSGCKLLKCINYHGTLDEWNSIYKGDAVPVSTRDSE